jgi:general secretion pathway protein B
MSFILDALKKSENERQRQSAPALFEVKVAAPRRMFPIWVVGLAILLGVNVCALAWVLLRDSSGAASAPAAVAAEPAAQTAAASAPPGMVTVPATVTIPTTVNIPINAAPSITMGTANHSGSVDGVQYVEEPVLSGHETPVPPDYNANDYVPAITPAQAGAVAAARRAGGVPSRDELLAQGLQIPDLRLDLHVYAVSPAERFVFINMRKLREGDSLPDGVRVEEITQSGAHLSYRGSKFSIDGN